MQKNEEANGIFSKEFEILKRSERVLEDPDLNLSSFREEYEIIAKEYSSLYKLSKKLVKISDTNQKRLLEARERLEEQNDLIQTRNYELKLLNESKDKLLKIINSDLKRAADYVHSMLPPPINKGILKTDWHFVPSQSLGGDSFGYHWFDDKNFVICLLDVSGHGIGAALHSISVLNTLRNKLLPDVDFSNPAEVLKSLNERFQMYNHNEMFFTIWYGVYNVKNRTMEFAGGGHPPALLFPNGEQPLHLASKNFLIGGSKNVEFNSNKIEIPEKSSLFLFSDGVYEIEVKDEGVWAIEHFSNFLSTNMDKYGKDISLIYNDLTELTGLKSFDDDFSILRLDID